MFTPRQNLPNLLPILICTLFCAAHTQGMQMDFAQPPDKAVTQYVKPLLNALNTRDNKALKQLLNKSVHQGAVANYMQYLNFISNSHGELQLHGYRDYQPKLSNEEVVVIVRSSKTEIWLALTLIGGQSHLEIIDISPAKTPSNLVSSEVLTADKALEQFQGYLHRLQQREVFSGNVLITQKNQVLLTQTKGQASKRFNVNNTLDTRFNLASVSKMFTGMAMGILHDRGRLDLNKKVSHYLPADWLPGEIAQQISLTQLLDHSSGLGNSALSHPDIQNKSKKQFTRLQDFKYLTVDEKLVFAPGEGYSYSNTGLLLAGAVIEKVTNTDVRSFVQQCIFQPLKMLNTGFYDLSYPVKNLAIGYERDKHPTGWRNNYYEHFKVGSAAGGAYSTSADMHKFAMALLEGALLTPETHQTVLDFYKMPGSNIVSHAGDHFGISTAFELDLDSGLTSIVLSNYANGATGPAHKFRELFEKVEL